jgi:hypothetical protein
MQLLELSRKAFLLPSRSMAVSPEAVNRVS